jgi:hypothetical protein
MCEMSGQFESPSGSEPLERAVAVNRLPVEVQVFPEIEGFDHRVPFEESSAVGMGGEQ